MLLRGAGGAAAILEACDEVALHPEIRYEGAMMSKLTIAATTIALVLAGGPAFADDNSMSQWTGESFKAFEAARAQTNVSSARAVPRTLNAIPDNGMSQFNGDSYAAFEQARRSPDTTSVASVRAHAAPSREVPPRTAMHGRSRLDPFRNDTAA
jgi:hypothetical protein